MSTIDITFSGLAVGSRATYINGDYDPGHFGNTPYSAHVVFITDNGTLSETSPGYFRLDGGITLATLNIDGFGTWNVDFYQYGPSYLTWQDNFTHLVVNAGEFYSHIDLFSDLGTGSFQFGLCPTTQGGPCGNFRTADMALNVVPGPLVGSGLSSLILTLLIVRSIQWLKKSKA